MTDVYREDGRLKDIFSFDSETYLINPNLSSPRMVCGTFASNKFPQQALDRIEAAGPTRGEVRTLQSGIVIALCDAELYVEVMADAVCCAWMSRHDETPLLLLAHNASYDIATLLQRARLMELKSTIPASLNWPKVAAAVGIPGELATFELTLHAMLIDIMDVDGTGLPDSPCHVLDTQRREELLNVAAGKPPELGVSLGDLVHKYLGEDRTDDKKGPPCPTCRMAGKVEETYASCRKRKCSEYNVPADEDLCRGCGCELKTRTRKVPCPECHGKKRLTPWRLRFAELDGVPLTEWPEKPKGYALDDAVDSLLVLKGQAGQHGLEDYDPGGEHVVVSVTGAVTDEDHQVRAGWSLKLAQMYGPRSEPVMTEEYVRQLEENKKKAFETGRTLGFIRENGTRDTKVHQALVSDAYARLGKEPPRTPPSTRFPEGQIKTDADSIRESHDDRLIAYQEAVEKDYAKVIELGLDHALAADPGVLKATGRTSWKMYMHQPPRKGIFRECWVPREGHVFLSCDWSAAEMVALAQILIIMFGSSAMADAINAGQDLHSVLAVRIWNMDAAHVADQIDYDEFVRRLKAGDKAIKEARQFAKIGNFGFPGGLRSLVEYARGYGMTITDKQSEEVRDAWMSTWVNMPEYLETFSQMDRENGGFGFTYVQWVVGRVRGRVRYTNGCNTGFQGLVADAMKVAMWWAIREMYTPLWGGWEHHILPYPHSPGDLNTPRDVHIDTPAPLGPMAKSPEWVPVGKRRGG